MNLFGGSKVIGVDVLSNQDTVTVGDMYMFGKNKADVHDWARIGADAVLFIGKTVEVINKELKDKFGLEYIFGKVAETHVEPAEWRSKQSVPSWAK